MNSCFLKNSLLALLVILSLPAVAAAQDRESRIRVSCVGNSITYGMRLDDREHECYPARLQEMLGDRYEVGNFGKSGATLLRHGHRPYFDQVEFRQAMDFAGDIVVIHLGVNDTDPRNWPHYRDEFVGDYLALIDSLRSVNQKARFIIARMTPIGSGHPRFISGTKVWHGQIQAAIETVARASGAELIDFYEPLYHSPWLFPDEIHPDAEGASILAEIVYRGITGRYGGLQVSGMYSDNMVLPRERAFPIRGIADTGEKVTVKVGGSVYQAVADNRGRWEVTVGPFKAGRGGELRIETQKRSLVFADVAFGDIWLCSGQSNMEFEVRESSDARPTADSDLRLYDMKCRWRTDNVVWPASVLDSVNRLQYFKDTEWVPATEDAIRRFSAVGYAFGAMLRDSLNIPIGLICNAVGGSPAESWIDRECIETRYPELLKDWTNNDLIMPWVRGRAQKNLEARPEKGDGYSTVPIRHPYEPCYLFEAGVLPLDHYPITGVIWYQGESNAERLEIHEQLFPLLIDSWREYFGGEIPFYYVQLSSLERSCWPVFRDSQRRLLNCRPGLGMAVTSDLGDPVDVHYREKRPVGERLALQALAKYYGHDVTADGPLALDAVPGKKEVVVRFSSADGMYPTEGGPLKGFEVQDARDGLFHAVVARVDGETVRLDCRYIDEPVAVRYAWEPFTRANLVNSAGLPASTFRIVITK